MLTAKQFIQDIKSLDVKSCVFTNNVPKKTMPNLGLRGKLPALEKNVTLEGNFNIFQPKNLPLHFNLLLFTLDYKIA